MACGEPYFLPVRSVVRLDHCSVVEVKARNTAWFSFGLCQKAGVKQFRTILALLLITVLVGCATDKASLQTDAPDGFYRWEHNATAGFVIHSVDSENIFRISEIPSFKPRRCAVADFHSNVDNARFSVDIYGQVSEELWDDWHDIVIIQNHSVYYGIAKRTGSSVEVVLTTDTRKQADAIVSMLRSRYSLSP